MKFKINLEETICQNFEIEAESYLDAVIEFKKGYRSGKYVLTNKEVNCAVIEILDNKKGEWSDWMIV